MRKRKCMFEDAVVEIKFEDHSLEDYFIENNGEVTAYRFFDGLISFYEKNPNKYREILEKYKKK